MTWEDRNGHRVSLPAHRLLAVQGRPVTQGGWVYTGSAFTPDRRYLAQMDGTLVGMVHDPASIIEHRQGLALGAYGDLGANTAVAPPPGTRVELVVRNPAPPNGTPAPANR